MKGRKGNWYLSPSASLSKRPQGRGWARPKPETKNSILVSHLNDGAQVLGPSSVAFPAARVGTWTGSIVAQASTAVWALLAWHGQRWLDPQCPKHTHFRLLVPFRSVVACEISFPSRSLTQTLPSVFTEPLSRAHCPQSLAVGGMACASREEFHWGR